MATIPRTRKFGNYVKEGALEASGFDITSNDVNRFLEVRSAKGYEDLLHEYSNETYPLFGFDECSSPAADPTTPQDCMNMQTLLRIGIKLHDTSKHAMRIYEDASMLKTLIEVEDDDSDSGKRTAVEIDVPLKGGTETYRYLCKGLSNTTPLFGLPVVIDDGGEAKSLSLISSPIIEAKGEMYSYLFDTLSRIMIHDMSIEIRSGRVVVVSHSIASSLWLTLMDMMRKGKIIHCSECGEPCIAKPKRKNSRSFCSDACRQRHHRNLKKK